MASAPASPLTAGWSRVSGAVLPITFVGAVLVFIIPLPAGVLDLLLAANITLAVLVLLTALSVRTPLEFAAFPTILLATTLPGAQRRHDAAHAHPRGGRRPRRGGRGDPRLRRVRRG
jgi:hypothetical protein